MSPLAWPTARMLPSGLNVSALTATSSPALGSPSLLTCANTAMVGHLTAAPGTCDVNRQPTVARPMLECVATIARFPGACKPKTYKIAWTRAYLRATFSTEASRQQDEGSAPGHAQRDHAMEAGHDARCAVRAVVGGRLLQRGNAVDAHAEGPPNGAAAGARPATWRPVSASLRKPLPVMQKRVVQSAQAAWLLNMHACQMHVCRPLRLDCRHDQGATGNLTGRWVLPV